MPNFLTKIFNKISANDIREITNLETVRDEVYNVDTPKYDKAIDINPTSLTRIDVTDDGFISFNVCGSNNGEYNVYINGTHITSTYLHPSSNSIISFRDGHVFRVNKGDVITLINSNNGEISFDRVKFIPPGRIPAPRYPSAMIPDWSKPELHFTAPHSFFTPVIDNSNPSVPNTSGSDFIMPYDGYFMCRFLTTNKSYTPHIRINYNVIDVRVNSAYEWNSFCYPARKDDRINIWMYGSVGNISWEGEVYTFPLVPSVPPLVNDNYSLTEINTGKKWIDNKDIYRKVIVGTLGTDQTIAYSFGFLPNFNQLVHADGVVKRADGHSFHLGYTSHQFSETIYFVISDQGEVRARYESQVLNLAEITFIIEYTKTDG
jgi:hypothetical protein